MKSFKLHLFVVTCFVLATCSRMSAAIPPLLYDTPTPGAIMNIGETFSYTLAVNAKDVLNFTLVATKSTSGTFGPCIILYDPLHNPVDSAGGSYNQDVEMNGYVAKLTGTYEVSINDCANQATGDYEIFVQKSNAPIGALPLAYAAVKTGVITSVVQSNAYTITANINDVLNFTVVATTSLSGTLGPCILLYNTTGNPLLDLAGGSYNQDVEMNGYKVPATGTYNVFIKDCADAATGDYTLFVQKSNDPINSVPIVDDQIQPGAITSAAQSNAYTFIGTMNDVMNFTVVTTKSTSGTLGPCILLYNTTAPTPLDSAGGSYNQNVEMNGFKVPETGTYNVFIRDCADTATGTYDLETQCLGACLLPAPFLTSISPASAPAGSPNITLTLNGGNFANVESNSVAEWGATHIELSTAFESTTKLTAVIPHSDLLVPGIYPVRVCTPPPGGGCSNSVNFTVTGPLITSLSLSSAIAGGPSFTLIVNGSDFTPTSVVKWNGTPLMTTYVSATELKATVPAADIATAGKDLITVSNGANTSPAFPFFVDNPVPVLTSLSPSSIIAGGSGFTLTVSGSKFVKGSLVEWNGKGLTTTYVSATELQAAVPASYTLDGTISITVYNSTPGGGSSSAKALAIDNPVPVVMSPLSPASVKHGSGSFTLTVNGFDFNEGAKVLWNKIALATVFVSDTQLQATVPATDITTAGSATVTVANPAPTPGPSNPVTFTIN